MQMVRLNSLAIERFSGLQRFCPPRRSLSLALRGWLCVVRESVASVRPVGVLGCSVVGAA